MDGNPVRKIQFAASTVAPFDAIHILLAVVVLGLFIGRSVGLGASEVRFADQYDETDASGKIAACIADLPPTGGICDARGLKGEQTFSKNPFHGVEKPVTILTGEATFRWNPEDFYVDLPSHLHLIAEGTTLSTTVRVVGGIGGYRSGFLNSRLKQTYGTILAGSTSLRVPGTAKSFFKAGVVVAILGASGGNPNQATTLEGQAGLGISETSSLEVLSTSGFPESGYVLVDSEIIAYRHRSVSAFTNLSRGVFGTARAFHSYWATVSGIPYLITETKAVSGNHITIADSATFSVKRATVLIGATDIMLQGTLTLDGNQDRTRPDPWRNLIGFHAILARGVTTSDSVVFKNFDHGGVMLQASRGCSISGTFEGNGRPAQRLGADLWIFSNNRDHRIRTVSHKDGYAAVIIDDRSVNYNPLNGKNMLVSVEVGPISDMQAGVIITGGADDNLLNIHSIQKVLVGISVSSGQWTNNPVPRRNHITVGPILDATQYTIFVAPTASYGENVIYAPADAGQKAFVSDGNTLILR